MSEVQAQLGMCIENRYRIVKKIAEGGMATVYKAQDERLNRPVALKIMHTQLAQGLHREQFIARFRREATSAASIANPHIVQVYDTGEFEGLDYLVMEYVHGVNLRYEMNKYGTFSVKDTLRVLAQTLDGLASAHLAGVVHRDIKPENILINDRGNVQITDFGLARAISQATLSSTGLLLGTAAYLAPEMIEKNLATPQGDLYSAGMMAWEMLAGRVPFNADNSVTLVFKHVHEDTPSIKTVCKDINSSVADFLSSITAREMEKRPSDASKALNILRRVCSGLSEEEWQYKFEVDLDAENQSFEGSIITNKLEDKNSNLKSQIPLPPSINSNTFNSNTLGNSDSSNDTISNTKELNKTVDMDKTTDIDKTADIDATQALSTKNSDFNEGSSNYSSSTSSNPLEDFNDNNMLTVTMRAPQFISERLKAKRNKSNNANDNGKKTRKNIIIISASCAAIAAAAVAFGAYWYYLGPGSYWSLPKPNTQECASQSACKITNVPWADYERTLKISNIPYSVSKDFSDNIPEGNIIFTNPDFSGSKISKRNNGRVKIVVSKGVRKSTIPEDIIDPTSNAGKDPIKALKKAGFTSITHKSSEDIYSLEIPKGCVVEISPTPGMQMNHNKNITVILSKGPMPVSMPDVVNLTKEEADKAFNEAKLVPNYSEEFNDKVGKGKIISASVQKGTQMHWGDKLDVVVSKGPKTITMPDVRNKNANEARRILESLGLKVNISAPLGDLMHTVRFQSAAPGSQVRVLDESGNPTTVTLTII
ncbi:MULTISPECIES: protein kinase domain-containing protein [Gardnerella]|uniref:non-specific serine/threonine protein kinase n=1 Tax=Gardnerella pickettii TaxID=2914924 RepID=A0ABX4SIN8_9BIFI|nr:MULTISPECIES: PASTA domain-containing protein [Gardnerella]MDK7785520.1 PASTA domain-containing protein [Bifidobacterium sp. UMB6791B]MDK8249280.1 PASTA domain-containing protein [Bifidobacterium sp. UMB6794B]MDK8635819.1 PASTA domain-containing protein [Bifidobacterium sp. UMB6791A]PMC45595.1 serine/threonine-protein kinase [Peptoniphilus lacrimalis]RFT40942.1 serine/threonine-protein kinase [Bifidobacteriaceae bacterium N170]RIY19647.1 serine/threonine-protein kinase [Bifidobacteriaceae 